MKKKIIFVIHQLTFGGAQRVIINIMNNINSNVYEINLIIFKNIGELKDELKDNIVVYDLKASSVKQGVYKLYKTIKYIKPDIIFSGISHVNLMISIMIPFLPKEIKYIARETSIVSLRNKREKFPKLFDFLYKNFYKNFDLIISQSKYMKNDLIQNYKIDEEQIRIINNPINFKNIQKLSKENLDEKVDLLVVGRLDENKNFKDIISILPKLNLTLTILGEGEEKENLINLANKLGVNDKINFLGFQSNPYKYMKNAKLLILTSKYEGFPNVVLEANACGLPVVAYNCPGGTGEIIEDGLNGFLVKCGNINELTKKIRFAVAYNFDRAGICKYTYKTYDLKNIIVKYEEVM